jgi:hypothetical protein
LDNKYNSYKYHKDNIIHHCCGTWNLPGWFFLKFIFWVFLNKRGKNVDDFFPITCFKAVRLKAEDIRFRKHYPDYERYYKVLDKIHGHH